MFIDYCQQLKFSNRNKTQIEQQAVDFKLSFWQNMKANVKLKREKKECLDLNYVIATQLYFQEIL